MGRPGKVHQEDRRSCFSPHALFGEAVEDWLRQQRNLDVIGWEADTGQALVRIQQLDPGEVILEMSVFPDSPTTPLMKLLSSLSGRKILGPIPRSDSISIIGREQQRQRSW